MEWKENAARNQIEGPAGRGISGRRGPYRACCTRDPSRCSIHHFLVRRFEEYWGQEDACPKMVEGPGLPGRGHSGGGTWPDMNILQQMYKAGSLRSWIGARVPKTSGRRSGRPASSSGLAC